MTQKIELPSTFTVTIEEQETLPWNTTYNDTWRSYFVTPSRYFVVLWFGSCEVRRWEWEKDVDLEARRDLTMQDAEEFIAAKFTTLLRGLA